MRIERISVENFRSLKSLEIELGKVNVFIGANSAGKTSILETIGIISAVMSNGFTDDQLKQRGVRLGVPSLIKSSFKDIKYPTSIKMGIEWIANDQKHYQYTVNVNAPNERNAPWKIFAESFKQESRSIFGRSNRSKSFTSFDGIGIDSSKSMYSVICKTQTDTIARMNVDWEKVDVLKLIESYGIYCPNTNVLRGIVPDSVQKIPVGLYGGRLPEAIVETLNGIQKSNNKNLRKLFNKFFGLNDWVSEVNIGLPSGNIVSSNVPTPNRILRFKDKYMNNSRDTISAYDANEGVLYTFFLACLALHTNSPKVFAIDNFDYGMNPRLARAATEIFCNSIIETDRTALLTTHNPLVLDGLDLSNNEIRLFAVERNRNGHTTVDRIKIDNDLLKRGESISSLWLSGRLGGMPNL